jgi:hypothetical protein
VVPACEPRWNENSSGLARVGEYGVGQPHRYPPRLMPNADPYTNVKHAILRVLAAGVAPHGFTQFRTTTYFIRDRGPIRDLFFFQKMRSNAVTIAYGVTLAPSDDDWSPGIPNARWLRDQEYYRCKYVEHVDRSIARAVADFESEALPWFDHFQTKADLRGSSG